VETARVRVCALCVLTNNPAARDDTPTLTFPTTPPLLNNMPASSKRALDQPTLADVLGCSTPRQTASAPVAKVASVTAKRC